MSVVGVGYEGRSLPDLIRELEAVGVEAVVDVRLTPISRKPGFSKNRLESGLTEAGISYVHEGELGNPRENREGFRQGLAEAEAAYRRRLEEVPEAIDRLLELADAGVVALLCVEREDSRCHRRLVIDALLEHRPDLQVTAL